MIAFSGVRSSWDMLARNCDLCWRPPRARGSSPRPPGTAGRSRSPAPTGWRTSGAARRPSGGNAPGVLRRMTSTPTTRSLAQQRHRQQRPEAGPRRRRGVGLSVVRRRPGCPATWTGAAPARAPDRRRRRPERAGLLERRRPARRASGTAARSTNSPSAVVELVDRCRRRPPRGGRRARRSSSAPPGGRASTLTAWPTSPSARSSSTERVSSRVRS